MQYGKSLKRWQIYNFPFDIFNGLKIYAQHDEFGCFGTEKPEYDTWCSKIDITPRKWWPLKFKHRESPCECGIEWWTKRGKVRKRMNDEERPTFPGITWICLVKPHNISTNQFLHHLHIYISSIHHKPSSFLPVFLIKHLILRSLNGVNCIHTRNKHIHTHIECVCAMCLIYILTGKAAAATAIALCQLKQTRIASCAYSIVRVLLESINPLIAILSHVYVLYANNRLSGVINFVFPLSETQWIPDELKSEQTENEHWALAEGVKRNI